MRIEDLLDLAICCFDEIDHARRHGSLLSLVIHFPSPLRGSHMEISKSGEPSPTFPLARCEAMGEGGRRPSEGSLPETRSAFEIFACFEKVPSSALWAPCMGLFVKIGFTHFFSFFS